MSQNLSQKIKKKMLLEKIENKEKKFENQTRRFLKIDF